MKAKKWTTALPNWESKIVAGKSLLPVAPLFPDQVKAARDVFDDLRLVDVAGSPKIKDSCREWIGEFADAIFGSYDEESGRRLIRNFFLLVSKKNSKSTTAAAIMLTALMRNWRKSAEFLIVAPTIEVANNSFGPASDMVAADPELAALLHVKPNFRTIVHRNTNATLKVVAADNETVSGKKAVGVLVDELWLFGKRANAENMLREATGGLAARPEGFVVYLSTQSDEPPAGVFRQKLQEFRDIRDGKVVDPKSLGVLYEFPQRMLDDGSYRDPANFYITNPNLGASVDPEFLVDELVKAERNGVESLCGFAAKHLNVEIGLNLRSDRWAGADFWLKTADKTLTLESLLERSEVVVIGIDGGGLDDLLGLAVLGREKGTRRWLMWCRAWAHECVLERRKEIAPRLIDFKQRGEVWIIPDDSSADVEGVADIVEQVAASDLLPEKDAIGVDPVGINDIRDELELRGFGGERIVGIRQGWTLSNTIKVAERRLAGNDLVHDDSGLMNWSVGNAKVEPRGNAILITKQTAGSAKIDPLMAGFNAIALMAQNPAAGVMLDVMAMVA